jgi:DNA-binding CsgD family transcriptional regulator
VSKKHSRIFVATSNSQPPNDIASEPRSFLWLDITERQLEILGWVHQGKSSTDIGGILGISRRTVEHHLEKVCGHLGVRTRFQAVLKVRDLGLLGSVSPQTYPSMEGKLASGEAAAPASASALEDGG